MLALVIKAIRKGFTPKWKLNAFLERALEILSQFEAYIFNHIYREANRDANELANKVVDGFHIGSIGPLQ